VSTIEQLAEALEACLSCFEAMTGRKPQFVEAAVVMSKEALAAYRALPAAPAQAKPHDWPADAKWPIELGPEAPRTREGEWYLGAPAQAPAQAECDAIAELNHAQWLALENVRLLAARHRKEEWAQHMLRFCEEAGVKAVAIHRRASDAALAATPAPQAVPAERETLKFRFGYDRETGEPLSGSAASSAPAEQGEIDYTALIAHCYLTLGHAQGTKGCIAFARGAEWMRDQLAAPPAAQPAEPTEKGTAGWLIAELSKWPAGAVVHGHQSLLRQFRVSDVFAAGDGNDGADTGHAYLWLDAESEEDAAMADAIDAAPHPSQPAEPQRVGLTYTFTPEQVSALCVEITHRKPSRDWMDAPLKAVRELLDADHMRIHRASFNAMDAAFHGIPAPTGSAPEAG
jgi:hypothetical protein